MSYTSATSYLNRIFATKNTEYHIVDGVCLVVRDTRTGYWSRTHAAVGSELVGGMRRGDGVFETRRGAPLVGDQLCFSGNVLTSTVVGIRRATDTSNRQYAALAA